MLQQETTAGAPFFTVTLQCHSHRVGLDDVKHTLKDGRETSQASFVRLLVNK